MPRIIACRSSGDIDCAAATSASLVPRTATRRGATRGDRRRGSACRSGRRLLVGGDLGEPFRDGLAPRRLGGSVGEQRLEGALRGFAIPALQRRFRAIEPGARIVAGFGELGLSFGRHNAAGREHEELAEFGVQPRLVRR